MWEDHWSEHRDAWVRTHVSPRDEKYTPTGSDSDGPDLKSLKGTRLTVLASGSTVQDTLLNPIPAESKRWTGCTVFPKRQS